MSFASFLAAFWSLSVCGMCSSMPFTSSAARLLPSSTSPSASAAFLASALDALPARRASAVWRSVVGDMRRRITWPSSSLASIRFKLSMISANPEMKKYPMANDALFVLGRISSSWSRSFTFSLSITAALLDIRNLKAGFRI